MHGQDTQITTELDPITIQIQWSRLITIMDEVDAALVRTSFSTIVGETRDFAVIMLDRKARSVAQSQLSSPAFTNSLPIATRHMLQQFPVETLEPGDVLITNDPWLTHGHLPDLIIVQPLFASGKVIAFLAAAAHVSDIGGRLDQFGARDVYEEGLRIPPSKLFLAGQENEQLFRIIEANVRVPRMVIGDIYAIVGAYRQGEMRLAELVADAGVVGFHALTDEILARSEAAMRCAIRAIPSGHYAAQIGADGFQEPIRIRVGITVDGDTLHADYTGSSPQATTTSINCVMNVTFAHTIFPLKCSLTPSIPNNEGLFRPITAYAPEGSLLNARFPAAVRTRSKASYHIHNAIYAALAPAMPECVQAGSGSFWSISCLDQDAAGTPVTVHVLPNGGKGAVMGSDGLPTIAFPGNGTITPAEIIENGVSLYVQRRTLRPDSGGAGEFRGGLGSELAFSVLGERALRLTVRPDKRRIPAPGLNGGLPGATGELLLDGEALEGEPFDLLPGAELILRLPGGGGLGDPARRNRRLVTADVEAGYVTEESARQIYGWDP
jgi:N-methylhydantoinase B